MITSALIGSDAAPAWTLGGRRRAPRSSVVEGGMSRTGAPKAYHPLLQILAEDHGGPLGARHLIGTRHSPGAPRAEDVLGRPVRERRTEREVRGEGPPLVQQELGRRDMAHEPPARELLGGVNARAVDHLRGPGGPDPRRQTLGPAGKRKRADDGLDLPDLSAGGGPDQIAGKCYLERPRKTAPADESNRRNRYVLDRADQRQRLGHQRAGLSLVKPREDRDVGASRERVALGAEQNGTSRARRRLVGGAAQVRDQSRAEQVEGRVVDHDLAELIVKLEDCRRHYGRVVSCRLRSRLITSIHIQDDACHPECQDERPRTEVHKAPWAAPKPTRPLVTSGS